MSEHRKWPLTALMVTAAAALGGTLLSRELNDDFKYACPAVADQLADGAKITRRQSPDLTMLIENEGPGQPLSDGTIAKNMVSVLFQQSRGGSYRTFIHNFGEFEYTSQNGDRYFVDVQRPPQHALEIDAGAADVLICPEK